jgi:hypothetical protein
LPARLTVFNPLVDGFKQAMQQLVSIADHVQTFMLMLF